MKTRSPNETIRTEIVRHVASRGVEVKHIVLFSGGLSSFMAAVRVGQNLGNAELVLVFTDTNTEDKDLYRFLQEASEYLLPAEFVWLKDGRDIWQVFEDVKFQGNNRKDPCSRVLKRELFRKWLEENYSPEECVLYYGIGWDEVHRLPKIVEALSPYKVEAPMTRRPFMNRDDMVTYVKDLGITPPRLYSLGFPHNNCGGFCVKTGQAQFKLLYETMPERYKYHEEKQESLFQKLGKRHPFIRMTIDGELKYLSLREFREILEDERRNQVDLFDYGGCGCFIE